MSLDPDGLDALAGLAESPITADLVACIGKHLETNFPPEGRALDVIRRAQADSGAYSNALLSRIGHLRNQLAVLEAEHETLLETLGEMATVMNPVRRVPDEVLGEIFSAANANNPAPGFVQLCTGEFEDSLAELHYAPWTLSKVCRKWRHIVTSRASLWTEVCIHLDKFPKTPAAFFRLSALLARSKDRLLTVHLYSSIDFDPGQHVGAVALLNTASRWKCLGVSGSPNFFSHCLTSAQDVYTALKVLHVDVHKSPRSNVGSDPSPVLWHVPNVHHLVVQNAHTFVFMYQKMWGSLSTSALRFFYYIDDDDDGPLYNYYVPFQIPMLSKCRAFNLIVGTGNFRRANGRPIRHASALSLTLFGFDAASIRNITRSLVLPSLTTLRIVTHATLDALFRPDSSGSCLFAERAALPLARAELCMLSANQAECEALGVFLDEFRELVYLAIDLKEARELTGIQLTGILDALHSAPKLQKIEFKSCRHQLEFGDSIEDMIRARTNAQLTTLRRIVIRDAGRADSPRRDAMRDKLLTSYGVALSFE